MSKYDGVIIQKLTERLEMTLLENQDLKVHNQRLRNNAAKTRLLASYVRREGATTWNSFGKVVADC